MKSRRKPFSTTLACALALTLSVTAKQGGAQDTKNTKATKLLEQFASEDDGKKKRYIAWQIGRLGKDAWQHFDRILALVADCRDDDARRRLLQAAYAIEERVHRAKRPPLDARLGKLLIERVRSDEACRASAISTLAHCGERAARFAPDLIDAIDKLPRAHVDAALRCFSEIAAKIDGTQDTIEKHILSASPSTAESLLSFLRPSVPHAPASRRAVAVALRHRNERVRAAAVRYLWPAGRGLENEAERHIACDMLEDESIHVREAARGALTRYVKHPLVRQRVTEVARRKGRPFVGVVAPGLPLASHWDTSDDILTLADLRSMTQSKSAASRQRAWHTLRRRDAHAHARETLAALASKRRDVKRRAMEEVPKMLPPRKAAIPTLIAALAEPGMQGLAERTILALGDERKSVVSQLLRATRGPLQRQGWRLLGKALGAGMPPSPELFEAARRSFGQQVAALIERFKPRGERARDAAQRASLDGLLLRELRSSTDTLARFGRGAMPSFEAMLKHTHPIVREAGTAALAKHGDPAALTKRIEAWTRSTDIADNERAIQVLRAAPRLANRRIRDWAIEALSSEAKSPKAAPLVRALLTHPSMLRRVQKLLRHERKDVRDAATAILYGIRGRPRHAHLLEAIRSKHEALARMLSERILSDTNVERRGELLVAIAARFPALRKTCLRRLRGDEWGLDEASKLAEAALRENPADNDALRFAMRAQATKPLLLQALRTPQGVSSCVTSLYEVRVRNRRGLEALGDVMLAANSATMLRSQLSILVPALGRHEHEGRDALLKRLVPLFDKLAPKLRPEHALELGRILPVDRKRFVRALTTRIDASKNRYAITAICHALAGYGEDAAPLAPVLVAWARSDRVAGRDRVRALLTLRRIGVRDAETRALAFDLAKSSNAQLRGAAISYLAIAHQNWLRARPRARDVKLEELASVAATRLARVQDGGERSSILLLLAACDKLERELLEAFGSDAAVSALELQVLNQPRRLEALLAQDDKVSQLTMKALRSLRGREDAVRRRTSEVASTLRTMILTQANAPLRARSIAALAELPNERSKLDILESLLDDAPELFPDILTSMANSGEAATSCLVRLLNEESIDDRVQVLRAIRLMGSRGAALAPSLVERTRSSKLETRELEAIVRALASIDGPNFEASTRLPDAQALK